VGGTLYDIGGVYIKWVGIYIADLYINKTEYLHFTTEQLL